MFSGSPNYCFDVKIIKFKAEGEMLIFRGGARGLSAFLVKIDVFGPSKRCTQANTLR